MTDEIQFPSYQTPPAPVEAPHPKAGRPLLKLMTRALRGRKGKSIWGQPQKRKKPRVI